MGVVLSADHPSLDRRVALKLVLGHAGVAEREDMGRQAGPGKNGVGLEIGPVRGGIPAVTCLCSGP